MKLKHYIIEGFCGEEKRKGLACKGTFKMNADCFTCPEFYYVPSENELAYSNQNGVVETMDDWVGFGGDMEPGNDMDHWRQVWADICKEKIREAYDEYMKRLNGSD